MPLLRGSRSAPSEEDRRLLREALARLDPWTFWSVPLAGAGADFAVVGTTGAFAIAICPLEGYAEPGRRGLSVSGVEITGFKEATRAARKIHGRLLEASTFAHVEPMLCLTRAVAGSSRTIRGVRVVRLEDVATDIGGRARTLDPTTAKRGAEALGKPIASSSGPRPEVEDV